MGIHLINNIIYEAGVSYSFDHMQWAVFLPKKQAVNCVALEVPCKPSLLYNILHLSLLFSSFAFFFVLISIQFSFSRESRVGLPVSFLLFENIEFQFCF